MKPIKSSTSRFRCHANLLLNIDSSAKQDLLSSNSWRWVRESFHRVELIFPFRILKSTLDPPARHACRQPLTKSTVFSTVYIYIYTVLTGVREVLIMDRSVFYSFISTGSWRSFWTKWTGFVTSNSAERRASLALFHPRARSPITISRSKRKQNSATKELDSLDRNWPM